MSIRKLAAILGLFLSSFLSDKFGRRKILIVGSLLQILTCCLLYFCNSFPTLTLMVAASMLSCFMVIVPSYSLLSEVSQKHTSTSKFIVNYTLDLLDPAP